MVRKGLNKAELKHFREQLLAVRARLRGDVTAMADVALRRTDDESGVASRMPIHMADVGTDNFQQEFTLALMRGEEDTLAQVEAALERIESGTYGACEECHQPIPKLRLNAIPYTPYCVKCAAHGRRSSDS